MPATAPGRSGTPPTSSGTRSATTAATSTWYSKRATLSAVYSSALLYWLGDDSPGASATREFVGRRIDNVMQIEDVKARIRGNPFAAAMLKGAAGAARPGPGARNYSHRHAGLPGAAGD